MDPTSIKENSMRISFELLPVIRGKRRIIWSVAFIELLQNFLSALSLIALACGIWHLCNSRLQYAWPAFIIVLALVAVGMFSDRVAVKHCAAKGAILKAHIRVKLFARLLQAGPQYIEQSRSGELVISLWEKVEWLSFYFIEFLPKTMAAVMISLAIAAYCLYVYSAMGLVLLIICICLFATPTILFDAMKKTGEKEWSENDKFFADCIDGIQGITTLKAFNINDKYREKLTCQAERMRKSTMKNLVYTTANNRMLELFITCGQYIPFIIAVYAYLAEKISQQNAVIVFFLLIAWKSAADKIMGAWLKGNKGLSGVDGILQLMNAESFNMFDILQDGCEKTNVLQGNITLDGVSFQYMGSTHSAVENVSLHIRAGTTTALVGASGAGKSTLAQLLFGIYKPTTGQISIGKTTLSERTVNSFRNSIAAIWQDSHIFNCSCMENIRLARPDATDEEVYAAARKANLHDFILSLPNGYLTIVGNGGTSISGGEKQRIAIARAFLKDAPILIMDEATSSLDRKNEVDIYKSLQELKRGRTVIIIAHRLETVHDADQICVMEDGKIVGTGTHQELLLCSNAYRELVTAQKWIRRKANG